MSRKPQTPAGLAKKTTIAGRARSMPDKPAAARREPVRPVVIVVGMHRAGAATISNVLHFLGCDMTEARDVEAGEAGALWERAEITALNDEVLAALGRPLDTPAHVLPFPTGWWRRRDVQAVKQRIIEAVSGVLARSGPLVGFNDPRMARLLPLWDEVFAALNLEPLFVHAIRNPDAYSLPLVEGELPDRPISILETELTWLAYNHDVVRHLGHRPAVIVDYDDWASRPEEVVIRLVERLPLVTELGDEELLELIGEIASDTFGKRNFLDNPLKRRSFARAFYEKLREARDAGGALAAGQASFIDLLFRSIAPFMGLLEQGPRFYEKILEGEAVATELEQRRRQVIQLKEERNAAQAALEQARTDMDEALEKAARAETAEAVLSQHVAEAEALRRRIQDLEAAWAEAVENGAASAGKAEALQAEVALATNGLAAVRGELEATREHSESELARLSQELATATKALFTARVRSAARARADRGRVRKLAETLRRERQDVRSRDAELAQALAAIDPDGDEVASLDEALATAAGGGLHALAEKARQRCQSLAEELEQTRREFAEEGGRRDETLADAESARARQAAELEAALAEVEALRSQQASELKAAETELEVLRARARGLEHRIRDLEANPVAAALEPRPERIPHLLDLDDVLQGPLIQKAEVWPDDEGLHGRLKIEGDATVLVDVRCDGRTVASVMTQPARRRSAAFLIPREAGEFSIPWATLPAELAGRTLRLVAAGLDTPVGEVIAPDPLPRVPAVRQDLAYHAWLTEHEGTDPHQNDRARAFRDSGDPWPLISVVLIGAGSEDARQLTLESLTAQVHDRWELIATEPAGDDPRLRTVQGTDLSSLLREARGDLTTFVEVGDLLASDALLAMAHALRESPDAAFVYSDEDAYSPRTGARARPYFKPDWSPELMRGQGYAVRMSLAPTAQLLEVAEGDADWTAIRETLLRLASPDRRVLHLPHLLYHRSETAPADIAARREAQPAEPSGGWPRVSLIVPTRDRLELLQPCVDGFLHGTDYPDLEVVIVDNDSTDPATLAYLDAVSTDPRVQVLRSPGPFNFSALNNQGATAATGAVIGLMNNDLKVIGPDWLKRMTASAMQSDVGAVGARLLYGDGTLQHAGVTLGIGVASHRYKGLEADHEGHGGHLRFVHEVSAVTAACLVMRRDVWNQVGGLAEDFPVAYNDIDLCLAVRAAGYRILLEPAALLYHLESQSRGLDRDEAKRERLAVDAERLRLKWGAALDQDPYYNPNLSLKSTGFRLADAPRARRPWQDDGTPAGDAA